MSETIHSGTKRPRRRPGENRLRLLEAGIVEFGLHGLHGASTGDIAARAEVPQPHLYANYESKTELFTACSTQVLDELRGLLAKSGTGELRGTSEPRQESARLKDDIAGLEDLERVTDLARFVFQAVAVSRDRAAVPELASQLNELRNSLGGKRFSHLLLIAADSLLK